MHSFPNEDVINVTAKYVNAAFAASRHIFPRFIYYKDRSRQIAAAPSRKRPHAEETARGPSFYVRECSSIPLGAISAL